jgi:hypothetical protein
VLDRQVVPIVLSQGVETKADPKVVVPGKLLDLENGTFDRPGRIQRCKGYVGIGTEIAQSGGGDVPAGRACGTLKDELLITDGATAYSQSQAGWVPKGVSEALRISTLPIVRNTYQQTTPDLAVHPDGITVATWEDSRGGARYSVFDTATGQAIVNDHALGVTASLPKPIALGNYVLIVYYEADGTDRICYLPISVRDPINPGAAVDLVTDPATATPLFDVVRLGGVSGSMFVAYVTSGSKVDAFYMTSTLIQSASVEVVGAAPTALGLFGDESDNLWVAYYETTTIYYSVWTFTLAAVLAETSITTSTDPVVNICGNCESGTTATVFFEINPAALGDSYELTYRATATIAGVASAAVFARSVGLASKAFWAAGRPHVLLTHDSALQSTYFLASDLDGTCHVVARLAPGLGNGLTTKIRLPEVCSVEDDVFDTVFLRTDRLISSGGTIFTQCGVQSVELDFTADQQMVELSDNLHITSGILQCFDGSSVFESGFHLFPEGITSTPSGSGGSIEAGTYQHCVVFEAMDNFGCLHRSAPSVPVSVTTTGSTSSIALVIPTLRLTSRIISISVVVYRTAVNQTVFYRLTSITSPLLNDTTVDTVSYTDTVADASIIGNEQLYTTGGEFENIAPPAPGAIAKYKNRLVVVDAENPGTLWYSKEAIQGVPIEFSDSFVKALPQGTTEGVAALVQMDDKLVLFDSQRAYIQYGDGWAADGSGDNLSIPQALPTASGCTNPKSLAVIPAGLMFQSEKGIQLLSRGLELQYVGAPVEAWNSDRVTSAQVIPLERQIRFTLDSGVALVYDYYVNQWSTFADHNAIDATVWNSAYTYLRPTGKVLQESQSVYGNDGAFSPVRLRTSWLSFAGLQGFQRVRRLVILGEHRSAHKIKVSIAYDFNPYATQEVDFDPGTLLDTPIYGDPGPYGTVSPYGGAFPLWQFRIHLERQKCQSIQILIEESQVPPYGEGLSLTALSFEVGVKKGARKMAAARSFG